MIPASTHPIHPAAAIGCIALALAGCTSADARTIPASTDAQLATAVAQAKAGDRIQLAPGSYGAVLIDGRKITGGRVVLAGTKAAVSNIQIMNSSGWTVDGLEFAGGFDNRGRIVRVENSNDISLLNNLIRGQTLDNDPWNDRGVGIGLRAVKKVEIARNRFRDIATAVIAGSSADISFVSNSLAYVREGVNWVAIDGGVIRCNRFSHFFPNYGKREHPDAIQFWQNADGSSNNTLIEGNFFNLAGPRAVQGIFGGGTQKLEVDPRMRFRNAIVRHNIYYGSSLHGISLAGAENVVIERNTVISSPHAEQMPVPQRTPDGRNSSALIPKIRVIGDTASGRITDNIGTSITVPKTVEDRNNLLVEVRGNNRAAWNKVFAGPPAGDDPAPEAFLVRPGSAADKAGQGAQLICGAELPPAP